ncbi:hypothetical protein BC828DRAFT_372209 [Blastocladiella britannica]|nr:hypothetical protein BC828DRAFT_372209 [Blastocladiella britannica]
MPQYRRAEEQGEAQDQAQLEDKSPRWSHTSAALLLGLAGLSLLVMSLITLLGAAGAAPNGLMQSGGEWTDAAPVPTIYVESGPPIPQPQPVSDMSMGILSADTCAASWIRSSSKATENTLQSQVAETMTSCSCVASCIESDNCCADYSSVRFRALSAAGITDLAWTEIGFNMSSGWQIANSSPIAWPLPPNEGIDSSFSDMGVTVRRCIRVGQASPMMESSIRSRGDAAREPQIRRPTSARSWAVFCGTGEMDVVVASVKPTHRPSLSSSRHAMADWSLDYSVQPLQDALAANGVRIPEAVTVGIAETSPNQPRPLSTTLYYSRFTDATTIMAVLKSVWTAQPYCGYAFELAPTRQGSSSPFDPTEGRDWFPTNATYSLSRGARSPVAFDWVPESVDRGYDGVFLESGGRIVPWTACYIRRVLLSPSTEALSAEWEDVFDVATGEVRAVDRWRWFSAV